MEVSHHPSVMQPIPAASTTQGFRDQHYSHDRIKRPLPIRPSSAAPSLEDIIPGWHLLLKGMTWGVTKKAWHHFSFSKWDLKKKKPTLNILKQTFNLLKLMFQLSTFLPHLFSSWGDGNAHQSSLGSWKWIVGFLVSGSQDVGPHLLQ